MDSESQRRRALQRLIQEHQLTLPAMFVDLEAFDANCDRFARLATHHGKSLRIATKSLRVPALIARCLHRHPEVYKGATHTITHHHTPQRSRVYAVDRRPHVLQRP